MTLSIEKNQFDIDVNRIIFRTVKEELQGKVYVRFNSSNMTPSHSQSLPPPKGDMHSIRPKQTPNLPGPAGRHRSNQHLPAGAAAQAGPAPSTVHLALNTQYYQ